MGCNKMANKCAVAMGAMLVLAVAGCAPKRAAAPAAPPPPVKQSTIVLLPQADGKPGAIEVKNSAGGPELKRPYQAVHVERADVAPSQPFQMDEAEVRRLFGATLDTLPAPEKAITLHFDEARDELTAESQAQIADILSAIKELHSALISVTGHTDTTGDSADNYKLGLRRAQRVARTLEDAGVDASYLFVESHGDADLLVATGPRTAEPLNRRVEVIVR